MLLAEQSIPLALGIADYAYVLQTGRIAIEGKAVELENERAGEGDLSRDRRNFRRPSGLIEDGTA